MEGGIDIEVPAPQCQLSSALVYKLVSHYHQYTISDSYTYSPAVGRGTGTTFSTGADGCITAIRVWERANAYISGFQLRYNQIWSPVCGVAFANPQEIELWEGETIVQVSGKYNPSNYVYMVVFVTSKGRFLTAGQPFKVSFNFYSTNPDTELRMLSGCFDRNGITSLGAHWGSENNGNNPAAPY
ncbi:zymogen granule membrane protein 16-like [Genypterus blacodes]|uniref:zymogen granule membrane protein 16-like n=1 Tax=Genypterus blacodes TaxID=154954 RepID=UPI003F76271B